MRIRTVLIWFVVAGILAAAVAASRSGGPASPSEQSNAEPWTIPVDPARVDRLSLSASSTETYAVERVARGVDRWLLRWQTDTGEQTSWSADPERVRAAVRLLASTPVTPTADATERVTPVATVNIRESDGRSVDIGFGPRSAGGQVPVVVDVRDAQDIAQRRVIGRLPANTFDAFVRTPWIAWRDTALFDAVTANARAVSIQAGPYSVRLERGSQGWAITEPYALEADSEEVERALGAIASLRAAEFVDAPPADNASGLDSPIATIAVRTQTGVRRLALASGTGATGANIFARITTTQGGTDVSSVVHIDRESVAQLTAVPEAYARRTPLGLSSADIARVRFMGTNGNARFEARRTAGDWTIDGVPASPDQRDAINRLLTVMTLEPAARVATLDPDADGGTPLGEVRFMTEEGLPLGALKLAVGEELRLSMSRPLPDGRSLEWTAISENAKGVALWASAIASRMQP